MRVASQKKPRARMTPGHGLRRDAPELRLDNLRVRIQGPKQSHGTVPYAGRHAIHFVEHDNIGKLDLFGQGFHCSEAVAEKRPHVTPR